MARALELPAERRSLKALFVHPLAGAAASIVTESSDEGARATADPTGKPPSLVLSQS
jgi:hypothetical protein